MSSPFGGFGEEQRDDVSSSRRDAAPPSSVGVPSPNYGSRQDNAVESPAVRRSFGAISKGMIQTFQTTVQKNSRSSRMLPDNAPVSPYIQPRLQKMASEGSRMVASMQHSTIMDGVSDKLSSVNDKLGNMFERSSSFSMNRGSSDRGIYSSESARSWGRSMSAEISTLTEKTAQKVMPMFRRQNTFPMDGGGIGSHDAKVPKAKVVSFDYQLMKDSE